MKLEKIGINERRHKELILRLSEIFEAAGCGKYVPASELIDLIANEPSFTKKDCVYLGIYLATNHSDKRQE